MKHLDLLMFENHLNYLLHVILKPINLRVEQNLKVEKLQVLLFVVLYLLLLFVLYYFSQYFEKMKNKTREEDTP